jgi:hypothetical protein
MRSFLDFVTVFIPKCLMVIIVTIKSGCLHPLHPKNHSSSKHLICSGGKRRDFLRGFFLRLYLGYGTFLISSSESESSATNGRIIA